MNWQGTHSKDGLGTYYLGTVDQIQWRFYFPKDGRRPIRAWRRETRKDSAGRFMSVWIEMLDRARAVGLITMIRAARQAPGFVIQPYTEQRDMGLQWQAIDRGNESQLWRLRKPDNTKRASNTKIAAARGQRGNKGTAGNV